MCLSLTEIVGWLLLVFEARFVQPVVDREWTKPLSVVGTHHQVVAQGGLQHMLR